MTRLISATILLTAFLAALSACGGSDFEKTGKKLVIVGVDGMDPVLLQQFMDEGHMPNFKKLVGQGTFKKLGTSFPPQSPVAWSNLITGKDPGGHGVFDFLHRDPETYAPKSFSETAPPGENWDMPGKYQLPSPFAETAGPPQQSTPFWTLLEDEGVKAAVYRIPAAYPLDQDTEQIVLPDMGVPDLLGGMGTYYYFASELPERRDAISTGKFQQVTVDEGVVRCSIEGPPSPVIQDDPDTNRDETRTQTPVTVYLHPEEGSALIEIDGAPACTVSVGEWSEWCDISFDLGLFQAASGIAKFYIKEMRPTFKMYVAPLQLDPLAPASPLSAPTDDVIAEIAEDKGRFYTQGLAENTKALEEFVLTDAEFLSQADEITDERVEMIDWALDRYDDGLLFLYLSTIDLRSHMMWRHIEPRHPAYEEESARQYANAIRDSYIRVDGILGDLRDRIGEDTSILVMSDHGFSPYLRRMHLNRWLMEEGYLTLSEDAQKQYHAGEEGTLSLLVGSVDWSKTRAYGLGFNGIYLNVKGREGEGIVDEADRQALAQEIANKLVAAVDLDNNGQKAVRRAVLREEVYHGDEVVNAPDIIVCFDATYGVSDPSALGEIAPKSLTVFEDNVRYWSGNHLMDPEVVPGVLVTNLPVTKPDPKIFDVTATLLKYFDVEIPADFAGAPLDGGAQQ